MACRSLCWSPKDQAEPQPSPRPWGPVSWVSRSHFLMLCDTPNRSLLLESLVSHCPLWYHIYRPHSWIRNAQGRIWPIVPHAHFQLLLRRSRVLSAAELGSHRWNLGLVLPCRILPQTSPAGSIPRPCQPPKPEATPHRLGHPSSCQHNHSNTMSEPTSALPSILEVCSCPRFGLLSLLLCGARSYPVSD